MGKAAQAQAGRDRARDARLQSARERRLLLDPVQPARGRRIDEVAVDEEVAWEEWRQAEQAGPDGEVAAAVAIERLLAEKLAVKEVVQLTGLDKATVRPLRQLDIDDDNQPVDATGEGAGVEVGGRRARRRGRWLSRVGRLALTCNSTADLRPLRCCRRPHSGRPTHRQGSRKGRFG